MTDEQIERVQFQWLLAIVIIEHCKRRKFKQQISGCICRLVKMGEVRRVRRGVYEIIR